MSNQIKRTDKFFAGVSVCDFIVPYSWLLASHKAGHFVNEGTFTQPFLCMCAHRFCAPVPTVCTCGRTGSAHLVHSVCSLRCFLTCLHLLFHLLDMYPLVDEEGESKMGVSLQEVVRRSLGRKERDDKVFKGMQVFCTQSGANTVEKGTGSYMPVKQHCILFTSRLRMEVKACRMYRHSYIHIYTHICTYVHKTDMYIYIYIYIYNAQCYRQWRRCP